MKRGELWIADLPRPDKPRPVVLVSREEAYSIREVITVAPVTTRVRDIASHVRVGRDDGLEREGAINCDRLATIHRSQLKSRIARLRPDKLAELDDALHFALGLA